MRLHKDTGVRRWGFALAVALIATFWVSQPRAATGTFPANPASLGAIPDSPAGGTLCGDATGAARDVTFTVSGLSGAVMSVQLSMTLTHTWVGDIDARLIAPNATSHFLYSQTGSTTATGCGDDSNLAGPYQFHDLAAGGWWAAATAAAGTAPVAAGDYRSSSAGGVVGGGATTSMNTAFAGVANANGTWTLRVRDLGAGDTGSVTAASLTITTGAIGQRAPVDFTGDNRSDLAVVRNTGGGPSGAISWFWMSPNGTGFSGDIWGIATDFFVPADYDGDGKADVAVWRSGPPGVFYVHRSSDLAAFIVPFGQTGDDPTVIGDYDGDGKVDPAVYRAGASAGQASFWYFWKSTTASLGGAQWGQNGDFPAPGDYDGDGKYDFVVQRNAGGGQAVFYILYATGTSQTLFWGTPTDVICPGDYDGDGKTDLAIVRGVGGALQWHIRRSSDGGHSPYTFGASATDFPTQGDYDGDGKIDIAVWRPNITPSLTAFYVLMSGSGSVFGAQFGQNGDYPVADYNSH